MDEDLITDRIESLSLYKSDTENNFPKSFTNLFNLCLVKSSF